MLSRTMSLREEHLFICEGCSAYVDQVRKTIAVVGSLREDSIPPEMRDNLLESVSYVEGGGLAGGDETV